MWTCGIDIATQHDSPAIVRRICTVRGESPVLAAACMRFEMTAMPVVPKPEAVKVAEGQTKK